MVKLPSPPPPPSLTQPFPAGGRKAFRDFLKLEFSEENILFWLACEDLKVENNPAVIEEKARIIYEDYISILSPKEVSKMGQEDCRLEI